MSEQTLTSLMTFAAVFVTVGLVQTTLAQEPGPVLGSLTRAYPDSLCSSCADWNTPQQPFRIHHNTFYVGTHGLSSVLITSPDGHVLIDAALPNSAPRIVENIRALGFETRDIKLILNSHPHFDHAGGIAAIQQASGARVAANPASASVLERGRSGPDDPQYGILPEFPAVANVERFTPGDTLRVGSLEVVSHPTAGHTPGGTSWSWRSCQTNGCLDVVYADSQTPVSADDFRFTDSETYPAALDDFKRGTDVLESLSCDILITTHPYASSLWKRLERGPDGLIDSKACRRYAESARRLIGRRVRMEAAGQATAAQEPGAACDNEVIEGRVSAGEAFDAPIAGGLVFRLVPEAHPQNPSGWIIRVTPATAPDSDYAMVATPPYRFRNPRYVDTSYGVTAEEALSLTPRHFSFVATAGDYHAAMRALDVLLWPGTHTEARVDSARATKMSLQTYPATFAIRDGAATQPGPDHPLGVIEWMSFRVDLCAPRQ